MTGKTHVPDGWRLARLGDVADVAFSSVDKKTADGEVSVELCNYTDVFYNRRIRAGMKLMTATATPDECQTWSLKKGDVLFTKDSETPDEIGVPSYVSDEMPNVLCGYHLGLARPSSKLAYGAFLARALASRASAQEFSRIANGVTRFGLTLEATRNLPLLLPPLAEQRAIAAALDAIDDAIERTEAVIAATERLRDALLHELLALGVPGWHTAWKEAPGIGTIPACWEVVRLGDVVESTTYGTNASLNGSGSTPVLRMSNLQNGHIDLSELRRADLSDRDFQDLNLVRGDILFNRTNSLALVGKVAVVRDLPQPISFASYLVRLRTHKNPADPFWLAALLWSPSCQSRIRRFATPGVSQANINPTSLKSLVIPLPPLPEQRAIATALDGVDEAIERGRMETDMLQSLKSSAADALLTGRVRVTQYKKEELLNDTATQW